MKNTTKGAIAAGLIVTSASIISYANTGASKKKNGDEKNSTKLVLDVEKVDSDTVKVSIDNITEVPKALQFSVKLEGNVALKEDESSIRDLINETVSNRKSAYATTNTVLTDYSYNSTTKEIDVLITATDSLPKTGNKIDIFEMDIKSTKAKKGSATKYKVIPADVKGFKYVSNTNKEYSNLGVSYEDKEITMNERPEIESTKSSIKVAEGETLALTEATLGITMRDKDGEIPTLEVRQPSKGNAVIKEFKEDLPGIYELEAVTVDSYGEKSEVVKIQVAVELDNTIKTPPTILINGKELTDIKLNAGDIFEPLKDIKATDAKGRDVKVELTADKTINLNPDVDTVYTLTYTATDIYGNKAVKVVKLTVIANKAPIINGVKNHVITVGDAFDPMKGITVTDEDKNLKVEVESNLNVNIPGVYKIKYKVTDTKGKITRAEATVTVNPKSGVINNAPVIIANDRTLKVGDKFNPLEGVKATDKEDGEVKVDLVESTVPVDENGIIIKDGKFTVSLKATDKEGEIATKTIVITVQKKEVDIPENPGESIKPENPTPDKPEDTTKPEKPENKPGDSNEADKPEGEKPGESIKPEDSVPDKPEDSTKPEKPENKPGDSNESEKPEGEKPGDATNQENPKDEEQTNPGNTDNEKPGDSNNSDKVEGGNQGNQSNDESTESGKKEEGTKPENGKQENEKEKLPKTGDKGLLGVISTGLVALGGLFIINKRKK